MSISYILLSGVTIFVIIVALVFSEIRGKRSSRTDKLLWQKDESGLALVRYVQLNRQCSEEVAYQRLATFVKNYAAPNDDTDIENMLAHDRPGLVAYVQSLLVHDPHILDKI